MAESSRAHGGLMRVDLCTPPSAAETFSPAFLQFFPDWHS
jgi:hypothetical protein